MQLHPTQSWDEHAHDLHENDHGHKIGRGRANVNDYVVDQEHANANGCGSDQEHVSENDYVVLQLASANGYAVHLRASASDYGHMIDPGRENVHALLQLHSFVLVLTTFAACALNPYELGPD